MKNKILTIILLIILVCVGLIILEKNYQSNESNKNTDNEISKDNKIEAGEYYLEYGEYENTSYDLESGGGTYILNEDGTFLCTNFQGTTTGTYTVSLETYINSADTLTDWLICFKSTDNNILGNSDWIIDGNNQFSGIQDGGTFKHIEK